MKYYGTSDTAVQHERASGGFSLAQAFLAMHQARILDGRPLGLLLKQAVESSLRLVFIIGGLVVFFSVVLELLTLSHVMNVLYLLINQVLTLLGLPETLSSAIVNGFFEVTLGAKSAGEAGSDIALVHKAAIASFVLAWGGLSVHAQIVSILSHTDLRYRPFFIARLLQGFIASVLIYLFWNVVQSSPVWSQLNRPSFGTDRSSITFFRELFLTSFFIFISVFFLILFLYLLYRFCKAVQRFF
jgi:nucleoside recognition membrane protein YjiH